MIPWEWALISALITWCAGWIVGSAFHLYLYRRQVMENLESLTQWASQTNYVCDQREIFEAAEGKWKPWEIK